MNIDEQMLLRLPTLKHVGLALVQFARSLHPNGEFALKDNEWIYKPNFVAFYFYKKKEAIRMFITNKCWQQINKGDEYVCRLYEGKFGTYSCDISSPRHLGPAVRYIEASYQQICGPLVPITASLKKDG